MAMGRRKRSVQGLYFRMLLIGYFEGMDSERGIAWRIPIRLRLREFLGLELQQRPPDSFQRLADAAPAGCGGPMLRCFSGSCRCWASKV